MKIQQRKMQNVQKQANYKRNISNRNQSLQLYQKKTSKVKPAKNKSPSDVCDDKKVKKKDIQKERHLNV